MDEITRNSLIEQLRGALYQLESPWFETVEFEIADTEFSFDFSDDD